MKLVVSVVCALAVAAGVGAAEDIIGETYTILTWSRPFDSCDAEDVEIGSGTSRVIWSYDGEDPVDDNTFAGQILRRKGFRLMAEDELA